MLEQGKSEEEGAAEITCDKLITARFPILLSQLGGAGREFRSEVWEEGRGRRKVF